MEAGVQGKSLYLPFNVAMNVKLHLHIYMHIYIIGTCTHTHTHIRGLCWIQDGSCF